jgi:hypothetical protein
MTLQVLKRWIEAHCTDEQKAAMHEALVEAPNQITYDELGVILMRASYGLTDQEARKMVAEIFAAPDVLPADVLALLD